MVRALIIPDFIFPSGIYRITNTSNGKCYVGSSVRLKTRAKEHLYALTRGTHCNVPLLNSWCKYGEDVFSFEVLLYCSKSDLLSYEQSAIDRFQPDFNICTVASSTLGTRRTYESRMKMRTAWLSRAATPEWLETQRKMVENRKYGPRPPRSQEWLDNMSASQKGKVRGPFTDEHRANLSKSQIGNQKWLGKNHTDETKAKMSAASRKKGRFTEDQVRDIRARCLNGEPHAMIASSLGVSRETITAMHNRKVYAWVT